MTQVISQIEVRQPIAAVFDYVTTPTKWPQWHPSSVAIHGLGPGSARLGDRLTEEVLAAGRRERFLWTVVECDPPGRWAVSGEFNGGVARIEYQLDAISSGTRFTRELNYRITTPLLRVMNRLVLARRVRRESDHALAQLKTLLDGTGG